jgi:hypothetical protein
MLQLQWLVDSFPLWGPGFVTRSGHARYVVDEVALGWVFSKYFGFLCQFSFHKLLIINHPVINANGLDIDRIIK